MRNRFWKPHRNNDRHFERKHAERGEAFFEGDPRLARQHRLLLKECLTHERRPGRPVLIRFADQLEHDQ